MNIKNYKGKIDIGIYDYKDCELNIEYSKLQRVSINDVAPLTSIIYKPNESGKFELEKLSETTLLPVLSNYKIVYKNSDNKNVDVYLNLSKREVFDIKWELRKYLIQDRKLQITLLGTFIIAVAGKIYFQFEKNINTSTPSIINKGVDKKSPSESSSDLELDLLEEKDTMINNINVTEKNNN